MTILTPEVRALLKRMDADDAIDKAVELALEAAIRAIGNIPTHFEAQDKIIVECRNVLRALKEQK